MSATKRQATREAMVKAVSEPPEQSQPRPRIQAWTNLPSRFSVAVPDNALAPRIVRGYEVVLDSTKAPRDGDCVCVVDGAGHAYLRIYRDTRDGYFEAVPLNTAFQWPRFDSKLDPRVRIAAVLVKTLCMDSIDSEDDDAVVLFRALCLAANNAWRRAAEKAQDEGRHFDSLDCYASLGHRARGALQ